ncbi:hypothetical protein [Blastococcus saxobsidens]|uniref:Glyoxalase-like domain-containing protein n=1 Tax=Blastococcus saxobsidens (strain DD2) TaxID=1146883 RepID=H6RIW9_BLASD|nr:hypothetical protein [Blastococcus saxobsidens]CCG03511.1 protein of unknown function [Blastococcus saxobsidens DD2]
MPATVQPILVTPDIERLRFFYVGLLDAQETDRFPEEGPLFYLGLRLGTSELGLTADSAVRTGFPGRVLLSVEVPDVDALLPASPVSAVPRRPGRTTCLGAASRSRHRTRWQRGEPDPAAVTGPPVPAPPGG